MATPKDRKHGAKQAALSYAILSELMVWSGGDHITCGEEARHSLANSAVGRHRSNTRDPLQIRQSRGTYLALPRHADGRAVLVTGGTINDLLRLPYVEAVAHCLAVQLTLPIALGYRKRKTQPNNQ